MTPQCPPYGYQKVIQQFVILVVLVPLHKFCLVATPPVITKLTITRMSCLVVVLLWEYSTTHQNVSFSIQEQRGNTTWKTIAQHWKNTIFQYKIHSLGTYSFRVKACQHDSCSSYASATVSYLTTGLSHGSSMVTPIHKTHLYSCF